MDLSKLPGKEPGEPPNPSTGTAQPPPPPVAAAAHVDYREPSTALPKDLWLSGPEAFICVVAGLLLFWLGQNVFHHSDVTNTSATGVVTTISYWESWDFIGNGPLVLLGAVFIFEAAAMSIIRQRWAGWLCVFLMAFAGLLNLGAVIYLFPKIGLQLFPALAAAFGAYGCWSTAEKLR